MRLLLAEDDRMIGDSLRQALRLEGHAVDWVYDVTAAQAALAAERFAARAAGDSRGAQDRLPAGQDATDRRQASQRWGVIEHGR